MTNFDAIKNMSIEELALFLSVVKGNSLTGVDRHIYFCGLSMCPTTPCEFYRDEFLKLLNEEDNLNEFFYSGGEE